jgi:hypothetical protein
MLKDDQIKLTEEIVLTAFRLLTNKLGQGGLVASNEAAFQLEFGHILKTLGQLYEFRLTDKFYVEFENSYKLNTESVKSKSKNARVDIFLKYQTDEQLTTAAIELKFFKKKNHREPNNRYDVFKDIHNLELYKQHGTDLCYFFVATDHDHYVNQSEYSADTGDFDFRNGKSYKANKVLQYKTAKPHGPDLKLSQDYIFQWDSFKEWHYLKLKI